MFFLIGAVRWRLGCSNRNCSRARYAARQSAIGAGHCASSFDALPLIVEQSDDLMDHFHGLFSLGSRPLPAVAQHTVHVSGIGGNTAHLPIDRAQLGYSKVGKHWLEIRELTPT